MAMKEIMEKYKSLLIQKRYSANTQRIYCQKEQSIRLKTQLMFFLNKMKEKRINKKYQQLLLHAKFGGITTIDDTHTLTPI